MQHITATAERWEEGPTGSKLIEDRPITIASDGSGLYIDGLHPGEYIVLPLRQVFEAMAAGAYD